MFLQLQGMKIKKWTFLEVTGSEQKKRTQNELKMKFKSKSKRSLLTVQNWKLLGRHFSCHGPGLSPDSLLVLGSVLAVAGVGFGLSGVLSVGIVQQVLYAEQDLEQRVS